MGLSHLSILRQHPDVQSVAMCDSSGFVLDVLGKYTGLTSYRDYDRMLREEPLDGVVIATPTKAHFPMVRSAIEHGVNVFCEKPLTLSANQSMELAELARRSGLRTQVGYHNRFVAAFAEAKRLLELGAIGEVKHALAEAYGPVVLRAKASTWRGRRAEGGGALYDYAAHPLDLLTWYLGEPSAVSGTVLGNIFSVETEDEVYATLHYPKASAQLSVNWSDESYRKMSTKITLTGTLGRITVDRQECQVYLREQAICPSGYQHGWNVRYTTDLTDQVWFYVRGEEYSAELDYFVRSVAGNLRAGEPAERNSFTSAAVTDRVIERLVGDAALPTTPVSGPVALPGPRRQQEPASRVRQLRSRMQDRWQRRRQTA